MADSLLNVLSVDVEDYHNQLALDFEGRVMPPTEQAVRSTDRLLSLFDELHVRGTFFILGEIAEHLPGLVRRIASAGHELGVHGYHHLQVHRQTPEQFRESLGRAKKLVEDVAGRPAEAHRAVAFSIGARTLWALDILAELGFKYDSSIYPFAGRRYGMATAPRRPFVVRLGGGRSIVELPMSTVVRWGRRWPVCGGGYLRLFPRRVTESAIRTLNREGIPAVMYLHPYETEVAPRIACPAGLGFRRWLHFRFFNFHQTRRRRLTEPRLRHLLTRYRFGTLTQALATLPPLPEYDRDEL